MNEQQPAVTLASRVMRLLDGSEPRIGLLVVDREAGLIKTLSGSVGGGV